jgi:hypothetical protein
MTEAPRWRLIEPHYLNIRELPDGTKMEWEHKETDQQSGRMVRKLFPVPTLLDPKDKADHNYSGEIIVAHQGDFNLQLDYIFVGDPTPGMEPLNEAAQAITDKLRERWDNPIESLPVNGGMNPAEGAFMERMMAAFSKVASADNQTVPKAEYDDLKARLAALEGALAKGQSAATVATTTPRPERRV